VDLLVSSGMLNSAADLFVLRETAIYCGWDGSLEVSARNLISAIQNSRRTELARFLHAPGIPGVGARAARDLAAYFPYTRSASSCECLPGPGSAGDRPVVARTVIAFFRRPATRKIIRLCR
jgi:DNA ligase (NAD+)